MHYRAPIRGVRAPTRKTALIASPLQPHRNPIDDSMEIQKVLDGLKALHSRWESAVADAATRAKTVAKGEKGERGLPGRAIQGPKGEKGENGIDGRPGKDAEEADLETIVRTVLELMPKPENGKDAQFDPEKFVGALKGKLKLEHLSPELATQLKNLEFKTGARPYLHGGGDTVGAGTGVTITNVNGIKIINATGAGLSIIPISGTIDDTNETFTATSQPTLLNINGSFYQKTGGNITWTYLAGTITLSSPVGAGGSIFGI